MKIPIIDLFAGPGGLGEGFSSISDNKGTRIFDIKLSIEKDEHAHKTLELRSFYRQFPIRKAPDEYYTYIKNYNPKTDTLDRKVLFELYPKEGKIAQEEAWKCTLGSDEFPKEIVDQRIEKALLGKKNWLLIGGPPCQAYSLVGRSRNKGIFEEDQRVFLYREYLRIIAVHHPAIFVMENVKGLLSAKLDGERIFEWIKKDLKSPGTLFPDNASPKYKIYSLVKAHNKYDEEDNPLYENDQDFLIKTENHGVPQNRHRVILLGVREDLGRINFDPLQFFEKVKLKEVIDALPKLRSGIGREIIGENKKGNHIYSKIENNQNNWEDALIKARVKLNELFPDRDKSGDIKLPQTQGCNFWEGTLKENDNPLYKNWYRDPRLKGVLNHETRTHLKEDLMRYLFSALYLEKKGDFPKLRNYPDWLLPDHKNAKGGKFADRFRTQRPDYPATTVTSHISKDGHYFIHYDPLQCRSLTVREAARIQTFPDNYYFCGARTAQYHQVGNAVPPFLARQIGEIVYDLFKKLMINE